MNTILDAANILEPLIQNYIGSEGAIQASSSSRPPAARARFIKTVAAKSGSR